MVFLRGGHFCLNLVVWHDAWDCGAAPKLLPVEAYHGAAPSPKIRSNSSQPAGASLDRSAVSVRPTRPTHLSTVPCVQESSDGRCGPKGPQTPDPANTRLPAPSPSHSLAGAAATYCATNLHVDKVARSVQFQMRRMAVQKHPSGIIMCPHIQISFQNTIGS